MCYEINGNVPDFNVQHHYKLYRRESQRIRKSESGALDWDLWPVPCWHSCRQITGSSCRLCLPRASFIKWHVCHTFIFIRSAENQRWETVRGSGGWELLPLSHSLFVPTIAWGPITFSSDRSPPPLLSTALPRSPELQLQQHLPLNMQSACQGIKETYIHTNVVAGVKLIFTDIRSVRTYSPFIWSWRKRPEHCQLTPYQDCYSDPGVKNIKTILPSILLWLYYIIKHQEASLPFKVSMKRKLQ